MVGVLGLVMVKAGVVLGGFRRVWARRASLHTAYLFADVLQGLALGAYVGFQARGVGFEHGLPFVQAGAALPWRSSWA
jgi:hypothetical protein